MYSRLSRKTRRKQKNFKQLTILVALGQTRATTTKQKALTCELLLEMDTKTSVSELRDLLMATVSFSLSPVALDRLSRSLPARSTRWRVPFSDDRCAWFTAEKSREMKRQTNGCEKGVWWGRLWAHKGQGRDRTPTDVGARSGAACEPVTTWLR